MCNLFTTRVTWCRYNSRKVRYESSNGVDGEGTEGDGVMDQSQRKGTTETEAASVFEEMGLATSEQRDKILAIDSVVKPTPQVRYVIRLSNSSQPAPTAG